MFCGKGVLSEIAVHGETYSEHTIELSFSLLLGSLVQLVFTTSSWSFRCDAIAVDAIVALVQEDGGIESLHAIGLLSRYLAYLYKRLVEQRPWLGPRLMPNPV